ncbi:hypothetical protein C8Q78DRAFT_995290 [Trametes maxima]|nr:hypothetical protein C8Q78DRAFT_995290 [Trametes maxima]
MHSPPLSTLRVFSPCSRFAEFNRRRGWRHRGPRLLGISVGTLYVLDTVCWALSLNDLSEDIRHVQHLSSETASALPYDEGGVALRIVQSIAFVLMVVIGDATVWWRAWVLFPDSHAVLVTAVLFPTLVLLAGTIPTVLLAPDSGMAMWTKPEGYAGSCVSLMSNLVATGVIASKAWARRRAFKEYLGRARPCGTQTHRVMVLLVESGIVYCILWIVVLAIQAADVLDMLDLMDGSSPGSQSTYSGFAIFFEGCLPALIAMYPTVIILLVSLQARRDAHREHAVPRPSVVSISISLSPITPSVPSVRPVSPVVVRGRVGECGYRQASAVMSDVDVEKASFRAREQELSRSTLVAFENEPPESLRTICEVRRVSDRACSDSDIVDVGHLLEVIARRKHHEATVTELEQATGLLSGITVLELENVWSPPASFWCSGHIHMERNAAPLADLLDPLQFAENQFCSVVIASVFWTMLTLVVAFCAASLWRRSSHNYASKILGLAVGTLYALSTLCWAITLYDLCQDIHHVRDVANGTVPLFNPENGAIWLGKAPSWIPTVSLACIVTIADAIVWWRACVLYPSRAVYAASVLLPVSSLLSGAVPSVVLSPSAGEAVMWANPWGIPASVATFVSNATVTSLIAFKAWQHKQALKQYLGSPSRSTRVQKVLLLLVESGIIYSSLCALVLAVQVVSLLDTRKLITLSPSFFTILRYFFDPFLPSLVAMYPTIVVFIVSLQRHSAMRFTQQAQRTDASSTLAVAVPLGRVHVTTASTREWDAV